LSQLTNISTLSEANGTITVLLGNGQTSLVDGSTANALNVSFSVPQPPPPLNPDGPPSAQVTDSSGKNITSEVTSGQIGGLLNVYNSVLPSIQGDGSTTGSLNQLAKSFADRVNSLLTSGVVSAGPPVVNGTALFTYDPTNATNTAASLAVNPLVTTSSLAASSGLEDSTNAAATSLSSFANPTSTPVSSTGNMELTVGSSQYSINLTGQNNLQGLVSAINASGAPVSASIITGQSGDYLSVSATSAGATTLQLKDDPAGANTPFLTAIDGTNSNGTALALAALESSTNASALSSSSYATATATPVSSSPTFAMTLVVGSNQYSINLTGQNNLQGLVSAINASGAPVSASVASTPAGDYLSISANSAGSNALQLIDDPGGANKSLLTADSLAGQTYSGYFGGIAAGVGTDLSNATSAQSQAQNGLTQAESLRQQVSGVNLNQQATQVLQFQQAYEAASKVISVIDDLTQAAINIIQPSQIV
jgi:flagellar hook-associated protein 1 FlgK